MRISVIVPTFRRPDALHETLQRLVALDFPADDYEVIVVDDGSGDSTPEVVAAYGASPVRVTYLHQENSGVAKARNFGASLARGELLVFIDDDLIVGTDHLIRQLAVRDDHGDCLVNSPWVFSPATQRALEATPFGRFRLDLEDWVKQAVDKQPLADGRMRPSDLSGGNLGISARAFEAIGGFDEGFPFAGCEDQDFSYRAAEAGYTFIFDPTLLCEHNDERVDLARFCGRQRRGAHSFVYFVQRHHDAAVRPLLLENSQTSRFDPLRIRSKKILKAAYSTQLGLGVANWLTNVLENRAPESLALRRLYTATIGAHIFLGIREGLAEVPEVRTLAEAALKRKYGTA